MNSEEDSQREELRHLLSIDKNAKHFPKERQWKGEQKKLMKGVDDGPKVESSSYSYMSKVFVAFYQLPMGNVGNTMD